MAVANTLIYYNTTTITAVKVLQYSYTLADKTKWAEFLTLEGAVCMTCTYRALPTKTAQLRVEN